MKKYGKKRIKTRYQKILSLKRFIKKIIKDKEIKPAFDIVFLQIYREIEASLSFWKNKKNSEEKCFCLSTDKLQIGGGKRYLQGFVNLDLFEPADIIWDCRYGLPFPDNKFSFVFSEHFLEHIDFPLSVKKILKEIYRVLKPNGEFLIGVPDGKKIIQAYLKKDRKFLNRLYQDVYKKRNPAIEIYGDIDFVNYFFRDQIDNPKYTIHYWIYDEISLKNLLLFAGFQQVKRCNFRNKYCNPKRKFYTLYIKAIK